MTSTIDPKTGKLVPFELNLEYGRYKMRADWECAKVDKRLGPASGWRSACALRKGQLVSVGDAQEHVGAARITPEGWWSHKGLLLFRKPSGLFMTRGEGLSIEDIRSFVALLEPEDSHEGWMNAVSENDHYTWEGVVLRLLESGVLTREQIQAAKEAKP